MTDVVERAKAIDYAAVPALLAEMADEILRLRAIIHEKGLWDEIDASQTAQGEPL